MEPMDQYLKPGSRVKLRVEPVFLIFAEINILAASHRLSAVYPIFRRMQTGLSRKTPSRILCFAVVEPLGSVSFRIGSNGRPYKVSIFAKPTVFDIIY